MYLQFLAALPQWVLYTIYPTGTLLALGALTLLLRKIAPHIGLRDYDGDILDTATQNSIGGAYVILGFSLVLVIGAIDKIEGNVMTEATRIESLDRLLVLEGSPESLKLRTKLQTYTESLITDEWPLLREQKGSPRTWELLQELFMGTGTIKTDTNRQSALFTEIIRKAEEVVQSRQQRIIESGGSLPSLFWILSYCGLAGVVIVASLRLIEATPLRAIALATQLSVLALLFAAVLIIDHPFLGEDHVGPRPIAKALQVITARAP